MQCINKKVIREFEFVYLLLGNVMWRCYRSRACVDLELNIPAEPATTYFDIPIVRCQSVDESGEGGGHSRGFGRSLLADMLPAYLPDFVLQGTSQQNTVNRIHEDLPATVQVFCKCLYGVFYYERILRV